MQIPALYPRLIAGGTQQTLKGFPGALVIFYNPRLTVFNYTVRLRIRHTTEIKCWHCGYYVALGNLLHLCDCRVSCL